MLARLCLIFVATLIVFGPETGHAGAQGLYYRTIPIGERAIGLGGAYTGIADDPAALREFAIIGNYPNPFNPVVTIDCSIARPGRLAVRVYDVRGRLVRKLADGTIREAGAYRVTWDGRDESGRPLRARSSGSRCSGPHTEPWGRSRRPRPRRWRERPGRRRSRAGRSAPAR